MPARSARPRVRVRTTAGVVWVVFAILLGASQAARAAAPGGVGGQVAAAADTGMPAAPVIAFGLLSVCGLVAVAMLVVRLYREGRRAVPGPPPPSASTDAIEDELWAMISDARAGASGARTP